MCVGGGGGSNIFQGGGGGGSNANFKETHIICDFPGGVRTSYPPLDPHDDDDDDDDDDETFSI